MNHGISQDQREKLVQDLRDLGTQSDKELKERWRHLYGTEPPRSIHRSLLIPAIAGPDASRLAPTRRRPRRPNMNRDADDGVQPQGVPDRWRLYLVDY
jgi:hypothetical protein